MGGASDLAVKFNGTWQRVGYLLQGRWGHRSIVNGSQIVHLGGDGE